MVIVVVKDFGGTADPIVQVQLSKCIFTVLHIYCSYRCTKKIKVTCRFHKSHQKEYSMTETPVRQQRSAQLSVSGPWSDSPPEPIFSYVYNDDMSRLPSELILIFIA